MNIIVDYDSSVGGAPAGFTAAVNYVVNLLDSLFTNPISITIDVGWGEVGGESIRSGTLSDNIALYDPTNYTYSDIRAALIDNEQSATQIAAYATLPATDPTSGETLRLTVANSEALGLTASGQFAGYIGFNSNVSYDFTPGTTPSAGSYDFIEAAEHEISEVMGRTSLVELGILSPIDLFRYSAPGVRDLTAIPPLPYSGAYFSIDGGNTNLNSFNLNLSGDLGDWAPSAGNDAFDASVNAGGVYALTSTDVAVMNVIGWDTSGSNDDPDSIVACYCRGTLILTEHGEVAVEALAVGDLVVTESGWLRPVKWIGRRSYAGRFIAGDRDALPIVVKAGALAEGMPSRDLWLSPEHALYLDEVLVRARHLVNGLTITQVDAVERVEYFHIELAGHDVILAEGAPAETFTDCDNRGMFHNAGDYAALYPGERAVRWQFCAPRLEPGAPELAVLRQKLFDRAETLGFHTGNDPDLRLVVDGTSVRPRHADARHYIFELERKAASVWLASRSTVPAECDGRSTDRRRLGVCLHRIVLRDAHTRIELRHDHPALTEGFHADESAHRWTDGMARLPREVLDAFDDYLIIEIALWPGRLRYPCTPGTAAAHCGIGANFAVASA